MDLIELKKEQLKLAAKIVLRDSSPTLKTIGGIDCVAQGNELIAAVVVCEFPSMKVLETKTYVLADPFRYVPGFQAYREMPAMIEAYNQLELLLLFSRSLLLLALYSRLYLIVQRNKNLNFYPGYWNGISGFLDDSRSLNDKITDEIKEELGLDIKLIEKLGENEYVASDPKAGKKRKKVTYFLAESKFEPVKLEQKGGLDDARWFRLQDALELNFYEDTLPLITKAVQKLTSPFKGKKEKNPKT